jgi:hypothetical protein
MASALRLEFLSLFLTSPVALTSSQWLRGFLVRTILLFDMAT